MSYVLATPEMVAAAANNLAQIGSTLSAANAAALAPTTGVLAAGADEVSAAVASLFSGHAQAYQTLGTQAAAFHERFIQALSTAAGAYGSAEAANASPLQQALNVINAPTQTLLGRPLIGNGTNGAPGTGQAGGPGGLLYGNGGNGGSGGVGGTGGSAGTGGAGGDGGNAALLIGTGGDGGDGVPPAPGGQGGKGGLIGLPGQNGQP
ncbi:PE-PGRS family protein [Mycobacterium tuberculosis]|nr:PE-PGRS family protein [Mycobacterium tuberculosis]